MIELPKFLLCVAAICCSSVQDAADVQLDKIVSQLSEKETNETRLAAASKLLDLKGKRPLAARDALTAGLTDDDPAIRRKFAVVLASILSKNEQPCPVELVRALFDRDKDVELQRRARVKHFRIV